MYRCVLVLFAISAVALAASATDSSEPFVGTVSNVVEGDVLDVDAAGVSQVVRVFGVDSPDEGQPGFEEARAFTKSLVGDDELVFEPKGTDLEDRLVCVVVLPDGREVGRELARAGWAWRYKAHIKDDMVLTRFTFEAMESKRGIWANDAVPLAPWDFRGERPGDEVFFPFVEETVIASEPVIEQPTTIDLTDTHEGAVEKSVTINPDGSRRLVLKGNKKTTQADVDFIRNSNRIMREAVAQRAAEKRAAAVAQQQTINSRIQTSIDVTNARQAQAYQYPEYVLSGPVIISGGWGFPNWGFPRAIILPPQRVETPENAIDEDLWPYVRKP